MKRTQQTLFFQFTDKELAELPRIALQLKREGYEILELIGRRHENWEIPQTCQHGTHEEDNE